MTDEIESGTLSEAMLEALLSEPVLARMATASLQTGQPHVVPVWFAWESGSLWISSFRSTRKIKDLLGNPRCSIVVDTAESAVDYQAVIFEGRAELVTEPAAFVQEMTERIYARYLGPVEVKKPRYQGWIQDPENLLIRLAPESTYSWYSAARQAA